MESDWFECCPNWDPSSDPKCSEEFGNPNQYFCMVELASMVNDGKDVGEVVQPFEVIWDFHIEPNTGWETFVEKKNSHKKMIQAGDFYAHQEKLMS